MKIAFIGLGAMGYPMARHLAKQHELRVWNRTRSVAERFAGEERCTLAASLDECADAAAIITIVPTSREVDEIVDEIAPRLREGTLWIDCTSGDPVTSRQTARRLGELGVELVDAPVTGGTPGAEAGSLTVMIGGSEGGFRRAEEICRAFGKKIIHVGEVGFGHAIKAASNTMLAANMWAAAECLLSLKKMGMDLKTAFEVINAGSGRSNASENLLPKRILDGEWPVTFKLGLLDKDVRIAASTAHAQHLSLPLLSLTSQLYTAAHHALGGEADYIEAVKYAARMSGEEW
jgi:3-hydroxyisobutyrate dehydrogenase